MTVEIPAYMIFVFVLTLPVYSLLNRIWDTFDNWLKFKTMNKQRNPIGFNNKEVK